MTGEIMHVGITVKDMDTSIKFYRDILGLQFKGELIMEGEAADRLFNIKGCKVRVAYLNGSDAVTAPPIELIEFLSGETEETENDIYKTSISEVCFRVRNIDEAYTGLREKGVQCLSEPQSFDFTSYGFGKSKALYFRDPDGIILEFMETIE